MVGDFIECLVSSFTVLDKIDIFQSTFLSGMEHETNCIISFVVLDFHVVADLLDLSPVIAFSNLQNWRASGLGATQPALDEGRGGKWRINFVANTYAPDAPVNGKRF